MTTRTEPAALVAQTSEPGHTPDDADIAEAPEDTEDDGTEGTAEEAADDTADDPDTFSREYVEGLRAENAKYRTRAQRADEIAHRLHTELVRATNRLADPADLEYGEDHLTDGDTLNAAIDQLLEAKPHLRKPITPKGDVGQGNRGTAEQPASLLGILKNIV